MKFRKKAGLLTNSPEDTAKVMYLLAYTKHHNGRDAENPAQWTMLYGKAGFNTTESINIGIMARLADDFCSGIVLRAPMLSCCFVTPEQKRAMPNLNLLLKKDFITTGEAYEYGWEVLTRNIAYLMQRWSRRHAMAGGRTDENTPMAQLFRRLAGQKSLIQYPVLNDHDPLTIGVDPTVNNGWQIVNTESFRYRVNVKLHASMNDDTVSENWNSGRQCALYGLVADQLGNPLMTGDQRAALSQELIKVYKPEYKTLMPKTPWHYQMELPH